MHEEKQDIRSLSMEARREIRRSVFKLLEKGWKPVQIARQLDYSPATVYRWATIYKTQGKKALEEKPRGGSKIRPPYLSPALEKQIKNTLIDKTPDQLKMNFCLWNSRAIRQYIQREHGINLADRTVRLYMQRWGFSPQRPIKRAWQQSDQEVQEWLEKQYPLIKKQAAGQQAEIYWCDETGISDRENNMRGYAPRGKTPILKVSGSKRIRLNMISALNNQGKLRFMLYRESMSSRLFICFMKRLWKDAGRRVYLIADNLSSHHSQQVRKWLEENKEKVRLYYLPKYSPELNPDEYLNNDLKQELSRREASMNEQEMENKIRSHMVKRQRDREKVKRFFHHPKVRYAA